MKPLPVVWYELRAVDLEASRAFFSAFCGWETSPLSDYASDYLLLKGAEEGVSGAMLDAASDSVGVGTTAFVEVGDLAAAIESATVLGATVAVRSTVITQEAGSFAILRTPGGLHLGLWSANSVL